MQKIRLFFSILILVAAAILCQQIISTSIDNQERKQDFAEINHIKYGLFSITQWKQQILAIITDEVSKFSLTPQNEKDFKRHIEVQLDKLIDKVDAQIREKNSKTAKGKIKQAFINTFVDLDEIKEGIPQYADSIVKQMSTPSAKKNLRRLVQSKVDQYFDKTFEEQNLSKINRILKKTGHTDLDSARIELKNEVLSSHRLLTQESWLLILLAVILFAIAGFSAEGLKGFNYISLVLILTILLITGVSTPMIDLEAKISEMSFVLFDHPLKFENQILYFQSKSILDVFQIMITHREMQMKAVGILMVIFSVIFPLLKLFSSVAYFYNFRNARENKWVDFFVLRSGKWSMADVLVIAIFMAYIGFNGVITHQLEKLNSPSESMVLLTTNGTALQPGFFLFLAYTMLALVLSELLLKVAESPGIEYKRFSWRNSRSVRV